MNCSVLVKWKDDKTQININDSTRKCIIKEVDDLGILVEYTKYNATDLVYYTLHSINKIVPVDLN
jgi:hypothetical protein